jgi:hypothetical protein
MIENDETFVLDDIDDEDLEDLEDHLEQRRQIKDAHKRGQKPIENAASIPLFQHADKKQAYTLSYIKVIKTSRPNHGYKGQLPSTSTEETLLRTYGPGTYTLQGCNDQHQILIEQHEVYIAGDDPQPDKSNNEHVMHSDKNAELAIKMANHQAEQALKRQQETHTTTMKLVTDQSENTQKTLQTFFDKTQATQGDFFTAMQVLSNESKTQMAAMFQQTLTLMTMGHQQQMEFLRASNDRDRDQNNPMMMMQILLQGLQMGKEFGEGNDQEPWVAALKEGGGMLSNLVQLKSGSTPQLPNVTQTPQLPNMSQQPNKISQTGTQPKSKGNPVFSKEEIRKMVELKKQLNEKGLDLKEVLTNIEIVFQSSDDQIPDEPKSEDNIPDENGPGSANTNDNTGDSTTPDDTESI